ncbi:M10 family metallopeptidase C-terminal domain-containing protein [Sphingomonas sabuli]|uniref:M10 family metallopeptidase C-terminal domain-containing protein n=1 Tax=Sphingomonas sabuli TaxID=2764186 RepID=A0A7G9L156_9SPHN|nr:M10 family metallopeptidase C-terminal domain-containing protein [Sphingomonas sabuli]QNM82355.1 M10 family metallopeptidase C-terminal domain-containing protein [Sphingomonas sabuli]
MPDYLYEMDDDFLPTQNNFDQYVGVSDASADPYAGTTANNGLPIWTPEQAADNLTRPGVDWTFGNNGALDDGVLTFGFWDSRVQALNSYYGEISEDGYVLTNDQVYLYQGYFASFTPAQRAMATQTIQLWDDLIDIEIRAADSAPNADITFGFTRMSASAGAHAYYPQEETLASYGFEEAGRQAGDVWANIQYQGSFSGANAQMGAYGWFAITHELGHSLGLAHAGDYNASTTPPPITYNNHAYFFQDSQQYTIMSYFSGTVTGQAAINWNTGSFVYAQTPALHDILAVQNLYGADYETRSGDTVYGFNSNADRSVFDFTQNTNPIVTIWDGGGNDTLDLSGFTGDNLIDINEGAFSSAGNAMTDAQRAYWGEYFGLETDAEFDAFFANNGVGPDGRPVDNIAIAYGVTMENAIGGSGDDRIIGNGANNRLVGNAGNDIISGGDGIDVITLGAGNDVFVGEQGTKVATKKGSFSWDVITDFDANGNDVIDLSGLGAFTFKGTANNKSAGDLTYKVFDSINGAENALGIDIDGQPGAGAAGPVTVVYGNTDGGSADFVMVLLNTNGVDADDFVFGSNATAARNLAATSSAPAVAAASFAAADLAIANDFHVGHDYIF